MKNLPYYFIGIAALFALAGMGLGIYMGTSNDMVLTPAHAHNNLLGWVSMAIFGLYYRAAPSVAATRLTLVHFWVALVANLTFPLGIAMTVLNQGQTLAIVGSLLEIISMLIFAYNVWSHRDALRA